MSDFDAIADDLSSQGWSRQAHFLSAAQIAALRADIDSGIELRRAGVGRAGDHQINADVRSDAIRWLDPQRDGEREFLALMESLRLHLNRRLLLGLFDYEAHFARYAAGDFYRRHVDAFQARVQDAKPRRVLSSVIYLNDEWAHGDGGELVLADHAGNELQRIVPCGGTAVFFMSEEFPHEVLPARRERLSIAGWFRRRG